jgi:hypothetical protein
MSPRTQNWNADQQVRPRRTTENPEKEVIQDAFK